MSSDVGASRIWNRLLDAAFDNSDRRKHGMGALGRALRGGGGGRRSRLRGGGGFLRCSSTAAYSSSGWRRAAAGGGGLLGGGLSAADTSTDPRRRKLGGNAGDHRPYFTYWITAVQCIVLAAAMLAYGVGPVGVDLYKKAGMVSFRVFFLSTNCCAVLCYCIQCLCHHVYKRVEFCCFVLHFPHLLGATGGKHSLSPSSATSLESSSKTVICSRKGHFRETRFYPRESVGGGRVSQYSRISIFTNIDCSDLNTAMMLLLLFPILLQRMQFGIKKAS